MKSELSKAEILKLIELNESLTLEFKESFQKDMRKKIKNTLCAFLNSSGGRIIVGVKDDGTIKGLKITSELLSQAQNLGKDISPKININVYSIENVLVLEVEKGLDLPYSVDGRFFIRNGSSTEKLTRDEIIAFIENESKISFELQQVKNFNQEHNLDTLKIDNLIKLMSLENSTLTKNEILENLGLFRNGVITNLGVLFISKDISFLLPQAVISCVIFKKGSEVDVLDRKLFSSDFISNFNESLNFLKRHLNISYEIRTGRRKEILEIPEVALREAILNAMNHRNYFANSKIQIQIFDEKVYIINSGGLLSGLSFRDISKKSFPRNKELSSLLQRINFIEELGSGISRIKKSCEEAGVRVDFKVDKFWFEVVLYRKNQLEVNLGDRDTTQKMPEKLPEKLPEKMPEKILFLIHKNSQITIDELVQKLGVHQRTIERNISKLKQDGKLKRVGADRGGYWEVLEDE